MRTVLTYLCLSVLATAGLVTACHTGPEPETPVNLEGGAVSDGRPRAVVVFEANVRTGPGRGVHFAKLSPHTIVRLGERQGRWQQVEVEGPLRATGWVRTSRLGCRVLHDVTLDTGHDGLEVTLRPGALLAYRDEERAEEVITVETREHIAVTGSIPTEACGIGEPFVPELPRDGALYRLTRESAILAMDSSPLATLPSGSRFVVFSAERRLAVGRTDGPVSTPAKIDTSALEPDPRGTPLDRLAEPLGYSHEVIVDEPLFHEPSGTELARLPGGTPMTITERQGDWSQIRTFGLVQLEGWVPHVKLRRVSLDHNELDREALRRDHAPVNRRIIRDPEPD